MLLPLFQRSAEKLDADPRGVSAEASAHLGPTVPDWLSDFPQRAPELRRPEAMGYEERGSATGLLYARTG